MEEEEKRHILHNSEKFAAGRYEWVAKMDCRPVFVSLRLFSLLLRIRCMTNKHVEG